MGLLDRLRGLFGGGDGPPGGTRDPDDPPRDHPSKQAHGSHWDTLVPETDRETAIRTAVTRAVEAGDPVEGAPLDGATVTGYRLAEGPLGLVAVTIDGQVATAYPVGAGVDHTVRVESRREWESGLEAWLHGTVGDAALTTFATNYYAHPGARFEGDRTASLAGFLYEVGPASDETVVDADGEAFTIDHEFAGFTPWEAGAVDDYVVRTAPESVERVSLLGREVYRMVAPLFRDPDGETVTAAFYAGTHLGGDYTPAPGDPFQAPAWLQASFR